MIILIFPDGETFNTLPGCRIARVPDGLEIDEVEDLIRDEREQAIGTLEVDETTGTVYLQDEHLVPLARRPDQTRYAAHRAHKEPLDEQQLARRVEAGRSAVAIAGSNDEPETDLIDALANVMHFARDGKIDFEEALRSARMHYSAETDEPWRDRYLVLCDYYLAGVEEDEPRRYAACSKDRDDELAALGRVTTWDSVEEAFADLADRVLDGQSVDAVYDLETAERIEIHVSTPVVTRSEDQGIMQNPLEEDDVEAGE